MGERQFDKLEATGSSPVPPMQRLLRGEITTEEYMADVKERSRKIVEGVSPPRKKRTYYPAWFYWVSVLVAGNWGYIVGQYIVP